MEGISILAILTRFLLGFMTSEMFDDLSLSETDFITQISGMSNNGDEYGN
jgi:hypothetical protein